MCLPGSRLSGIPFPVRRTGLLSLSLWHTPESRTMRALPSPRPGPPHGLGPHTEPAALPTLIRLSSGDTCFQHRCRREEGEKEEEAAALEEKRICSPCIWNAGHPPHQLHVIFPGFGATFSTCRPHHRSSAIPANGRCDPASQPHRAAIPMLWEMMDVAFQERELPVPTLV